MNIAHRHFIAGYTTHGAASLLGFNCSMFLLQKHVITIDADNTIYYALLITQSLDTDVQRPFYSVATVALLPY